MSTIPNTLTREEVTMALEHVMFAPEGTAITPGRIDVDAPPAGFIHMGAVQDDSPRLAVTKTKFQLRTGIPRGLAYEAVMQLDGELQFVFHSITNQKAYLGLGGALPLNVVLAAHSVSNPTVAATSIGRTFVTVSTTGGFLQGQMVVTDAGAAIPTSFNAAYIASVGAAYLVLSGTGFPFLPVGAQPIVAIERVDYGLGTNIIPYLHLVGVADLLDGGQVIHDFVRATPRGQWEERLAVGQDARLPVVFDLHTYVSTKYGGGSQQLIVGERWVIPGNTIQ